MNVLLLSKYNVQFGGVAIVLQALAGRLREMGLGVTVYSNDPSAKIGELHGGVPCVYGALPRPGLLGGSIRPLLDLCRERKVDLINAHGAYRAGWAAWRIHRKAGIPYVVTSHGDLMASRQARRIRRPRARRRAAAILRDAAGATHLTAAMLEEACAIFDVRDKSRVIPSGTDLMWWSQPARPTAGRFVLAIGRHVPHKGYQVVLGAFGRLAKRAAPLWLVIAGEGPCTDELKRRAREMGLAVETDEAAVAGGGAGVCFPGPVSGDRKRNLFLGASLVTFSSQADEIEGFGIVQAEAMAAGKALVGSDIPAVRCVVTPGRHGLIVPADDEAAWADAMERLLTDEPLRKSMEAANRVEAGRYDWDYLARQYLEVYEKALAAARP